MKDPRQKYIKAKVNSTHGNISSPTVCLELFWHMGPYLFPFTVEYSLMAAVSCYVLFGNVGK